MTDPTTTEMQELARWINEELLELGRWGMSLQTSRLGMEPKAYETEVGEWVQRMRSVRDKLEFFNLRRLSGPLGGDRDALRE
jgi:hypothetical protein